MKKKSKISKVIKVKIYHYFHIGGFRWVRSSVLVGKLGFGRVRSSLEFVTFGFDPTVVCLSHHLLCSLFISQFIFVQAVTSDIHKYVYTESKHVLYLY